MTPRWFVPLLALWLGCDPAAQAPRAPNPAPVAAPPRVEAPAAPAPALTRSERRARRAQGLAAYERKEYAACATLLAQARAHYDAACCYALGGDRDAAFAQLALAIDRGFSNRAHLERDPDLVSLRGDPRWSRELAHLATALQQLDAELRALYEADQADRAGDAIDWAQVAPRDQARRARVEAILAAGGARVAADYYHAAMVFQHGAAPAEIQRARALALEAVKLDPDHDEARWLAAAAEDRELMYEDKPQKWGTQFKRIDGAWVLWEVDPAITDAQRAEWNVPPLAEARARAAKLNARRAP